MRGLVIGLALGLFGAQQPEPYPGQGSHQEPPDGWFCQRQNLDETVPHEKVCHCVRICRTDEHGTQEIQEDTGCTVWCHRDHCRCEVVCKDTH